MCKCENFWETEDGLTLNEFHKIKVYSVLYLALIT